MNYQAIIERCKEFSEFLIQNPGYDQAFLCVRVADWLEHNGFLGEAKIVQIQINRHIGGHITVDGFLSAHFPHETDYTVSGKTYATAQRSNEFRLEILKGIIEYCKEQIEWHK